MRKWITLIGLTLVITVAGFAGSGLRVALAQDPTIPTRTPTPNPNQPTPNPTASPDEPGNPPPGPTNTTEAQAPSASPTATLPAPGSGSTGSALTPGAGSPLPFVPLGGTIQANPGGRGGCTDTPYVEAIARVVVYAGPGTDFMSIATLQPDEMRPIVGRAGYATWWLIQVDAQMVGWVAAAEVNEYGNTALVPIVEPPAINGNTPTPGALWNPTPLPLLTCVPTPTPSTTPSGSATQGSTGIESAGSGDSGGASVSGEATATLEPVMADVESTPITATDTLAAQGDEGLAQGTGLSSRGSEASRAASPTSLTNLILPIAGLVLIGGGIILALLSRNRGQAKPNEPK